METMNETLVERFGRSTTGHRTSTQRAHVWVKPQELNMAVREYYDLANTPVPGAGPWLDRPEIPTANEVMDYDPDGTCSSSAVELYPNRPRGAWESKGTFDQWTADLTLTLTNIARLQQQRFI